MFKQIQLWVTQTGPRILMFAVNLDTQVLQWPGGSLIASVFWLYGIVCRVGPVGMGGSARHRFFRLEPRAAAKERLDAVLFVCRRCCVGMKSY
jgi:hypothetical protein